MNIAAHPVTPEEIMALLDAELPAERAKVVAGHMEECASCGSIAKTLRGSSQALAGWTIPAAPDRAQFEERLFATVSRVSAERSSERVARAGAFLRRHWIAVGVSALCVIWLVLRPMAKPEYMWSPRLAPTPSSPAIKEIPEASGNGFLNSKANTSTDGSLTDANGGLGGAVGGKDLNYAVDLARAEKSAPMASPQAQPPGPMIARTVSLWIVAKDFGSARPTLDAILARHHGYTASLTANTRQGSARSLQASLRIPANELSATIGELKALGQVQNELQGGEEVTQQHADLVARLKNSRETERRMQAILEQRAGKISDVLEVEQEIARVRGEIEQMEAEQQGLEHRVSFATIELSLAEEYKAQIDQSSPAIATRIHNSGVAGYRDAVENLVGVVLFCVEYGPSLLMWVAFLAPIAWIVRWRWMRASAVAHSVGA
jgi:hypothetical protein